MRALNLIVASGLLLTLASCGNDHKSKSHHKAVDSLCSELNCLSAINWKITLQGKAFPEKSRVDVNGTTVLNECVSKQKFAIDRSAEPELLVLDNFFIPKRGELKIDVIDMGGNCDAESMFIKNDDVDFEVSKSSGVSEILINL